MRRCTQILLCAVAAAALSGCPYAAPPPSSPAMLPIAGADTTLGSGDTFSVKVYGEKELSGKYLVSADGTIDFPLIGTVKVVGRTPEFVARNLRKKLADGYLRQPHISVYDVVYNSKKISVFGQVKKPGTFEYMQNMSIIHAITLAGGFTPLATKNRITVTRVEGGKSSRFTLPVEDIGEGKAANYLLHPGDIVFVPERVF